MYTDTAESVVISKKGSNYAQFFSIPFVWVCVFTIAKKSEAHKASSLLFKQDGVPNTMIMDGSKEQTLAQFKSKCRQVGCRTRHTESYSHWSNYCEVAIKEAKLDVDRDLRKSKFPKKLWNDCLKCQAYIISFTTHSIFVLQDEVPEILGSGETTDISEFAPFKQYDWVKYRDGQVVQPDNNYVLAKYLGPSFDIGPAMSAKLIKCNGGYIHRSTFRGLTEEEIMEPLEIKESEKGDAFIGDKIDKAAKPIDFNEKNIDNETPHNPVYEDDVGGSSKHIPDRESLEDDQYINSDVLLPLRDSYNTGKVIHRLVDTDGKEKGLSLIPENTPYNSLIALKHNILLISLLRICMHTVASMVINTLS